MKKLSLLLFLLLNTVTAVFAQNPQSVDMADEMQKSGKIYVVIAVIAIIFIGLAIFMFSMDRRIKKIEKDK